MAMNSRNSLREVHLAIELIGMIMILFAITAQISVLDSIKSSFEDMKMVFMTKQHIYLDNRLRDIEYEIYQTDRHVNEIKSVINLCTPLYFRKDANALGIYCKDLINKLDSMEKKAEKPFHTDSEESKVLVTWPPDQKPDWVWIALYSGGSFLLIVAKILERTTLSEPPVL